MSDYYYPSAYYVANILSSLPINILVIIVVFTPPYFLISFNHGFYAYVLTILLMVLLYMMILRVTLLVAILIESEITLSIVLPLVLAVNSFLAGYFVSHSDLHDAFMPL